VADKRPGALGCAAAARRWAELKVDPDPQRMSTDGLPLVARPQWRPRTGSPRLSADGRTAFCLNDQDLGVLLDVIKAEPRHSSRREPGRERGWARPLIARGD
jgi:hypothetical protein